MFKIGRAGRELPLGPRRGDVVRCLRTLSRVPRQNTGVCVCAWGATPRSQTCSAYSTRSLLGCLRLLDLNLGGRAAGLSSVTAIGCGGGVTSARREVGGRAGEEPGRGVSQLLAHSEPGEPEETNAGAAMGRQPCGGAKHTEGSAQTHLVRARGAGGRGRRRASVCGPAVA